MLIFAMGSITTPTFKTCIKIASLSVPDHPRACQKIVPPALLTVPNHPKKTQNDRGKSDHPKPTQKCLLVGDASVFSSDNPQTEHPLPDGFSFHPMKHHEINRRQPHPSPREHYHQRHRILPSNRPPMGAKT